MEAESWRIVKDKEGRLLRIDNVEGREGRGMRWGQQTLLLIPVVICRGWHEQYVKLGDTEVTSRFHTAESFIVIIAKWPTIGCKLHVTVPFNAVPYRWQAALLFIDSYSLLPFPLTLMFSYDMLREKENHNGGILYIPFWRCFPLFAQHVEHFSSGSRSWQATLAARSSPFPQKKHLHASYMLQVYIINVYATSSLKCLTVFCSIARCLRDTKNIIMQVLGLWTMLQTISFHPFPCLTAHPTRKPLFPLLSAYLTRSLFCPVPSQPITKQS